jgi:hypothetical protein
MPYEQLSAQGQYTSCTLSFFSILTGGLLLGKTFDASWSSSDLSSEPEVLKLSGERFYVIVRGCHVNSIFIT